MFTTVRRLQYELLLSNKWIMTAGTVMINFMKLLSCWSVFVATAGVSGVTSSRWSTSLVDDNDFRIVSYSGMCVHCGSFTRRGFGLTSHKAL